MCFSMLRMIFEVSLWCDKDLNKLGEIAAISFYSVVAKSMSDEAIHSLA